MLAKGLVWVSLAFCLGARADVNCPGIYQQGTSKDTYYVLTFVGGPKSAPAEPKLRQAKRGELESNVTPKLQDALCCLASTARHVTIVAPTG